MATGPGMCPKHGTTLLTWGDHVAAKRDGTPASPQAFPRWALFTLAAILALALLYKFVILKSAWQK